MPPRRHLGRRLTPEQRAVLLNSGVFATTIRPAWRAVIHYFGSIEEAKRAWRLHREELLAECDLLVRPHAWWWFESPAWSPDDSERPPRVMPEKPEPLRRVPYYGATLLEAWGLLTAQEIEELRRRQGSGSYPRAEDFL